MFFKSLRLFLSELHQKHKIKYFETWCHVNFLVFRCSCRLSPIIMEVQEISQFVP